MKRTYHSTNIRDLSLLVKLGCSPEERASPQEVRVSVELRFFEMPKATQTDDLRDTVCFALVSEALRAHVQEREFNLIEKMAFDFYEITQKIIVGRAEIAVVVHKVNPPVEDLKGGVEYRMGDFA